MGKDILKVQVQSVVLFLISKGTFYFDFRFFFFWWNFWFSFDIDFFEFLRPSVPITSTKNLKLAQFKIKSNSISITHNLTNLSR
jgi:hypothetical protein